MAVKQIFKSGGSSSEKCISVGIPSNKLRLFHFTLARAPSIVHSVLHVC